MKTPFMRQLMFVLLAAFAALPLFATPPPDTPFAVLKITQSLGDTINLAKATSGSDQLALAILLVNLDYSDLPDADTYFLMATYRAMHTQLPLPPTVLAQNDINQTGGGMFQVNSMFDEKAATLDQNPDGAWVITR